MTFVELLVAIALLALLTPILSRGLQIGRQLESRAARDGEALALAENQWALLRAGVLTADAVNDEALAEPWSAYRWSLTTEPWTADAVQFATVSIHYAWRNTQQTLQLTGLLAPEATE